MNKSIYEISTHVIFLDGDCLPHKHFFRDHIKLAEQGYFVQGRRCFVPETEVDSVVNGEKTLKSLFIRFKLSGYFKGIRLPMPIVFVNQKQRGLIGCNWSVWLEDLHRINGFNEDFEGFNFLEKRECVSNQTFHSEVLLKPLRHLVFLDLIVSSSISLAFFKSRFKIG